MSRRFLAIGLILATMAGCTIVPGVKMDDPEAGWPDEDIDIPDIQRITPQLIREMADRRLEAMEAENGELRPERDEEYRIGHGDVISIIVYEHPELTNPFGTATSREELGQKVRRDGTLFFPYVGAVHVQGLTEQELQNRIVDGLEPFIQEPQVSVRIVDHRSRRAYLTGQVQSPGIIPLHDEPVTILDALSEAGGFPDFGDTGDAADRRQAVLTRDGESRLIDLRALYSRGTGNLALQDGDILYVPDNRQNRVFVMGEVQQQTAVEMPDGELSLADAIAEVSGLDLGLANTKEIFVIRGVPETGEAGEEEGRIVPHIYQLDARQGTGLLLADSFALQPRDVVFVSSSELVRWNRVINQILPTISAGFQLRSLIREF